MPALRDPAAIRAILQQDRPWSAYFLADLAPGFFEQCSWFRNEGQPSSLAALYQAFAPPVLFALGDAASLATLLDEVSIQPSLYLHVRPEMARLVAARYRIPKLQPMWRMLLARDAYRGETSGSIRLTAADQTGLEQLFSDAEALGQRPDFFFPSMLEQGIFYGILERGELIAVAGTHVVAPSEGVAAVGNVYTRSDRRGRGLAARVTSAVVNQLLRMNLETIVLNVAQQNTAAARIYQRLGFKIYCSYYEGLAERGV